MSITNSDTKPVRRRKSGKRRYKAYHFLSNRLFFPLDLRKVHSLILLCISLCLNLLTNFTMIYNTAIVALCLTGSVLAAPVPQLLDDLSPDVAALVTGLGLGSLAPGVAGTLDTLGTDVKVKRQLLDDLSPDVAALVTGLGLGSLAPGVAGTLDTLGTDVKVKRQLLVDLSPDVATLLTELGLGSLATGVAGTLDTLGTDV
jgi:hypothetical protein